MVPNGAGQSAGFLAPTNSPLTVTLDEAVTLGSLQFGNPGGNPSAGYTISGSGANTLTLSGSGAPSLIAVSQGTHAIAAPIILAGNLNVSPAAGSTLTISGNISQSSTSSLTLSNSGC